MKTVTKDEKTGRRAMLAGSGAMLAGLGIIAGAGAPGLAADNPDAELVADCRAYCAQAKRMHDLYPGGATPIDDDAARDLAKEPIYKRMYQLAEKIIEATALTAAGHTARVQCFVAMEGETYFEQAMVNHGFGYDIVAALLRDLAGVV